LSTLVFAPYAIRALFTETPWPTSREHIKIELLTGSETQIKSEIRLEKSLFILDRRDTIPSSK